MTSFVYSQDAINRISREAEGKTVKTLHHDDAGYWVMTFSDDSECSFMFMTEVLQLLRDRLPYQATAVFNL